MRISGGSSDVCSSDLCFRLDLSAAGDFGGSVAVGDSRRPVPAVIFGPAHAQPGTTQRVVQSASATPGCGDRHRRRPRDFRSEEHTSELQSLMRISYAVFCLKKKKTIITTQRQREEKSHKR